MERATAVPRIEAVAWSVKLLQDARNLKMWCITITKWSHAVGAVAVEWVLSSMNGVADCFEDGQRRCWRETNVTRNAPRIVQTNIDMAG